VQILFGIKGERWADKGAAAPKVHRLERQAAGAWIFPLLGDTPHGAIISKSQGTYIYNMHVCIYINYMSIHVRIRIYIYIVMHRLERQAAGAWIFFLLGDTPRGAVVSKSQGGYSYI